MKQKMPIRRPARPQPPSEERLGSHPGWPVEMADVLGGLTDREDLARLFERDVDLPTIIRLMGRRVPRDAIRSLLETPNPAAEARKLLD